MPRRNKPKRSSEPRSRDQAPLTFEEMVNRVRGPVASRREGFEVSQSVKHDRRYRCPYCEGWIEAGVPHVVAYPTGNLEDRRHYHNGCWTKSARGS